MPSSLGTRRQAIAEHLKAIAAKSIVDYERFRGVVVDLFEDAGLLPTDAAIAAEAALYPQLCGSDSHGVVTMPLYLSGLLDQTIKPRPQVRTIRERDCTVVIDADHGLGLVESRKAMDLVLDLAAARGLGAAAVRNSSHFGAAGYYGDLAARRGMIGLALSNASPAIAPTGGVTPLLGTNPIGAGFPVGGSEPMVLDMATAVVARSRIRQMVSAGETTIPTGWALDGSGQPTTDPRAALQGSVLPIGEAKGYGLALVVELLCSALSDGEPGFGVTYENVVRRPSGISHFFLAIDPAGFAGREAFQRRAEHIAKTIESSKGREGGPPPRLPGRNSRTARIDRLAGGIPIAPNLRVALIETAHILEHHAFGTAVS
jgi:LDH2 family malate/lactate/ureidoglycolate dehydrogenase